MGLSKNISRSSLLQQCRTSGALRCFVIVSQPFRAGLTSGGSALRAWGADANGKVTLPLKAVAE
jgi:hypothetical protein